MASQPAEQLARGGLVDQLGSGLAGGVARGHPGEAGREGRISREIKRKGELYRLCLDGLLSLAHAANSAQGRNFNINDTTGLLEGTTFSHNEKEYATRCSWAIRMKA